MKSIPRKKAMYLLLLLVICLAGIGIKGTYAKFAAGGTTGKDIVSLNLSFNIGISNIEEYEEVVVEANDYKIFNVSIKNSSSNTAYYGVWYQMVIPSEKNDKIIIARSIDNDIQTTGSISAGDTKVVTIIAKNNTSSTIKLNVGVSSSEKSTDSIEYLGGKKLISGTTAEADYYYDEATSKYISTTDSSITFTTNSTNYSYTGSSQTFTPNHDGSYKLEAWGAQGGDGYSGHGIGGYGAYTTGIISLNRNNKVYINVGGSGRTPLAVNNKSSGGYNGGGDASGWSNTSNGSGGGATSITSTSGLLASTNKEKLLLVAGAGGGGATDCLTEKTGSANGGHAGGIIGSPGQKPLNGDGSYGQGGSQTAGGVNVLLNVARENASSGSYGTGGAGNSGGGAGYYGGSGASVWGGAGGGSSYIGNPLLINKAMYCYNCEESTIASTKTISVTAVSTDPIANSAKKGNGAAKVTPVVPTIKVSDKVINSGENLTKNDITCQNNGSGCQVVRITDTKNLSPGVQTITIVVKDDFGYLYKYVKTITIGASSKLISSVSVGSYVKYTGNNGCSGKSCEGQNANYVSNTDMGYCYNSSYKFNSNGWRVAYINDGTAYLTSGGSPECMCTDSSGNASTSCSSYETTSGVPKHLANLNAKALTYCNSTYAYGGVCNSSSAWNMNDADFKNITGDTLSTAANKAEGYYDDYAIINNGGFYWFATPNSASSTYLFFWYPDYRLVYYNYSDFAIGVRPVLRLKSSVTITSGSGTENDPYILSPN